MSLVLRRSAGQSIIVTGEMGQVTIEIFRIVDGVVHMGFDAPKSIRVERVERLVKNHNEQVQEISVTD